MLGYFVSDNKLNCNHYYELYKKEINANYQYCQHKTVKTTKELSMFMYMSGKHEGMFYQ